MQQINKILVNFGTGSQISAIIKEYDEISDCEVRPYFDNKYLLVGSALCGGKAYAVLEKFFRSYSKKLGHDELQYEMAYPNAENFSDNIYYTRKVISSTYAMTSIRRFRDEYQRYLDKNFLVFYYVVTEALLMADNRVKNMMIATWGKQSRYKLPSGEIVK